ncbi:MAG: hypothetical protein IJF70_07175 [Opitutales bacterium]|nr:hypothetical protein [Opitutales bacterium]
MSQFFPAFVDSFNELLTLVKDKKIAVVGHMRPDGDCIGSQFALAEFLRQAGAKDVVCLNQNPVPYLYENLGAGEKMLSTEDFTDTSY